MSQSRYREIEQLASNRDRETWLAEDVLTGRRLILKKGPFESLRREAVCLLCLPPGFGPRVVDLLWLGSQRLILVREFLEGRTLDQAAGDVPPGELPRLARDLCQALVHVHRGGWVLSDLKPGNILVRPGAEGFDLRLIDFGFAYNRDVTRSEDRGGTPPYLAPEILNGWCFDGRADLYSLGITLRTLFPSVQADETWRAIVDRTTQPLAARRYPDSAALRDEITAAFHLEPAADRLPVFPAGLMIGREGLLHRILRELNGPCPRLLLQGRPGIGLSRLLFETILWIAAEDGPAITALDLSRDLSGAGVSSAMLGFLDRCSRSNERVLCVIPDPSPGLRWSPAEMREALADSSRGTEWRRLHVPPLDAESFTQIVTRSLAATGPDAERFARDLYDASEGDFSVAADGFRLGVEQAGVERNGWELDAHRLSLALETWRARTPPPAVSALPPELLHPLRLCAQAGPSFPESLVRQLVRTFATPEDYEALVDHGMVHATAGGRASFVTRSLWNQVSSGFPPDHEIDVWLADHFVPDPGRAQEIIHWCRRARRLGREEQERACLAGALRTAAERHHQPDLVRLLAYPEEPVRLWTAESLQQQMTRLHRLLGEEWTRDHLLILAARSLYSSDPSLARVLLERAACGEDDRARLQAAIEILDRIADKPKEQDYARYLGLLRDASDGPAGLAGMVGYFEARRALALGRRADALALAREASHGFTGAHSVHEALNLQLLATMQFSTDPDMAIRTEISALLKTSVPERRAQVQFNLANMYGEIGELKKARRCLERAIRSGQDKVSQGRLVNLRLLRAWVWANLDHVDPALKEARALVQNPTVQLAPHRYIPARHLIGYCQLHGGNGRSALLEMSSAYQDAVRSSRFSQQMDVLRYLVDAALDLEAWDTLDPYEEEIGSIDPSGDAAAITTLVRARAFFQQRDGRLEDAAAALQELTDPGGRIPGREGRARYLHHCGLVALATSSAEPGAAARFFQQELESYGAEGLGYYRVQALFGLARALWAEGRKEDASEQLDRAIRRARRIEAKGILSRTLQTRAAWSI